MGRKGTPFSPPPVYGSKCSPTSDCYNARKRHTTTQRSPNLNVPFPHLWFCTLTTVKDCFIRHSGRHKRKRKTSEEADGQHYRLDWIELCGATKTGVIIIIIIILFKSGNMAHEHKQKTYTDGVYTERGRRLSAQWHQHALTPLDRHSDEWCSTVTQRLRRSVFAMSGPSRLWNSLPSKLRQCDSLREFKRLLETHLLGGHSALWHFCSEHHLEIIFTFTYYLLAYQTLVKFL